jgi:hypothetical protein
MTELIQLKLSLPPDLLAYVSAEAVRTDRTPSGIIRHWIAEQHRREPPRATASFPDAFAPRVPAFPITPEGVAEAKERVAAMKKEREQILRRKARWQTTVDEDTRVDRLVAEIEIMSKRIASAEKMLPRSRNGG